MAGAERAMKRLIKRLVQGRYNGLNGLDRKLERYVDYDGGYYVELGANDGVAQSNSLYFEKHRNWRGLLVEPSPHNFLKCNENRSPRNHIVCAACVSFGHAPEFVRMTYANLMSTAQGLESDIADPAAHARSGQQFLQAREPVFDFGAIARPLNDLLVEADAPKTIDFLSLDVEGAELEVLKGIDHAVFRFKYVLVECRRIDEMRAYLEAQRYRYIENLSSHDYLFASAG
jgi:FkbM family methyltransferase